MRTLPVRIPQNIFKALNSIILRFLWNHKKPRIKLAKLTKPKELGGVGLPNFTIAIEPWHRHEHMKDWVSLEADLCPIPLKYSPWIPWNRYPHGLRRHPLAGNTLGILNILAKQKDITTLPSPLTALKDNPDFIPGEQNSTLQPFMENASLLAADCFHGDKFKDWSSIKLESNLPHMRHWTYLQLRSYLGKFRNPQDLRRPLTDLESICHSKTPLDKATSIAYSWLQHPKIMDADEHRRRWSEELKEVISEKQWRYACILAHKCSMNTKLQERVTNC